MLDIDELKYNYHKIMFGYFNVIINGSDKIFKNKEEYWLVFEDIIYFKINESLNIISISSVYIYDYICEQYNIKYDQFNEVKKIIEYFFNKKYDNMWLIG